MLLPWGASEIVANLYVGDLQDAVKFDGVIISVLADVPACEPRRSIQLPFLANGRATLDSTAALIDAALDSSCACWSIVKRVANARRWWSPGTCVTRRSVSLDEAYSLLRARRPIVRDRRKWLGNFRPVNEATTNLERARPPGPRYLVGRYHEIGLKGRNRWRFVDELKRNLQGLFADYRLGRMRGEGRRLMVELPDALPDEIAKTRAALAFGLQNFSLSRRVPLTHGSDSRRGLGGGAPRSR